MGWILFSKEKSTPNYSSDLDFLMEGLLKETL